MSPPSALMEIQALPYPHSKNLSLKPNRSSPDSRDRLKSSSFDLVAFPEAPTEEDQNGDILQAPQNHHPGTQELTGNR